MLPEASFGVRDHNAVNRISGSLRGSGVEVAEGVRALEKGNVVVITGHKDASLRQFLEQAAASGALKGKLVLLMSCYAKGDVAFNSALIQRYQLTGIHFFAGELNPQAVTDTIVHLSRQLKDPASPQDLEAWLRKAVEAAARAAKQQKLKREIEKLGQGKTQLSRRDRRTPVTKSPAAPA